MRVICHSGLDLPANAIRAKYYSKKLATADGHPADGDSSRIIFNIDDSLKIQFTSERHFKLGPAIYRGKSFTEIGTFKIVDRSDAFLIDGLRSDGPYGYPYYVHTEKGILLFSESALREISVAIDREHKAIIDERKREHIARLEEIKKQWVTDWSENLETYEKVKRFTKKIAFPIFIDTNKLSQLETYYFEKWIKGSSYEQDGLYILQTKHCSPPSSDLALSQFDALIRLVSMSCQWDESYAACRAYGAILKSMQSESRGQCNITYDFYIKEEWSYDDCLKNFIRSMKENHNEKTVLACFTYYMISEGKVSFSEESRNPIQIRGFEEIYSRIESDLKPYANSFYDEITLLQLDKQLSSDEQDNIITVEDFDLMTGQEFEDAIANMFSNMGYQVTITPKTGDQGIDVIAVRNGTRIGIQAKCYTGRVGNSAVQEAVAGKSYYNLHRCMVITNSKFTKSAIELAKANNVTLWDRDVLEEKVRSYT